MLAKIIVFIAMIIIIFSLGSGLYYLVHDEGDSKRTVKALTWRICISLSLFLFLFLAFSLDWLKPHAL